MSKGDTMDTWTDSDGDTLRVWRTATDALPLRVTQDGRPSTVVLNRHQLVDLHAKLGELLAATEPCQTGTPDATVDGYDWPADTQTILEEAQAAVHGDRQADYGHPRQNFTRTAIGWHMVLMDKLADGESITPQDVALCMVQVKVAREAHQPKRDNRVDGAGYFETLDRLETGR